MTWRDMDDEAKSGRWIIVEWLGNPMPVIWDHYEWVNCEGNGYTESCFTRYLPIPEDEI